MRNGKDVNPSVTFGDSETYISVRCDPYEFFIYDDGASILAPTVDERFELPDFPSLDALQNAFIRRATELAGSDFR